MNQRVALVEDGFVVNMISVAEGDTYIPDPGMLAIVLSDDSPVSIGWLYDSQSGEFTAPPTPEIEPYWCGFRIGIASLDSYKAIAAQMHEFSPTDFQTLQSAITYDPPYLPFVLQIWNDLIDTGIEVPSAAIAEWNAIAADPAVNVPLQFTPDGHLIEVS